MSVLMNIDDFTNEELAEALSRREGDAYSYVGAKRIRTLTAEVERLRGALELATIESGLADVERMVSNTNDQRIPHQHSILTVEMARHCGYLYGLIQAWKQNAKGGEGG